MFLKLMEPTGLPDASPGATYRLIECKEVRFGTEEGVGPDGAPWKQAIAVFGDDNSKDCVPIKGNAYILNNSGKTIDSFWPGYYS